jgi:transposase
MRRQLKRPSVLVFFQKLPPCLVGMEACGSSHHWSRELRALGHAVRLMPPAYVAPTQACNVCRGGLATSALEGTTDVPCKQGHF